ncbi:MAG: SRPBCC family protein [Actinobacteria bacterium]|nr:SRPBCC family protein [Actinomycetota bacterium]MSY00417.1 SRPBCC family protein [Actinomycetota bacterium]MTA49724.1 SRPBCC family protein [Actinomycetota bacterium]MTA90978.1 SRPBCC family protein [Actinomycetota bacterium]
MKIELPCSQQRAWAAIADWESQGDWMLQTKVWVTSQIRDGVGTSISAFTGPLYKFYPKFSSLGLLDTMVVTNWQPPEICDVEHTGKILKGTGSFELSPVTESRTKFDWSETIDCPRLLFLLVAPFLWVGVRISLARLATSLRPRE